MSNESENSDEESLNNVMSADSDSNASNEEETEEEKKQRLHDEQRRKKKKKSKGSKSKVTRQKSDKSPKPKQKPAKAPDVKLKEIKTSKDDRSPIDKSKLRYSQTNVFKPKSKVAYDRKAEESISNLINRRRTAKPLFKTTSFTAKEYVDRSAVQINQIEADQNIVLKEKKPVIGQRISPEKMTESLHVLVKHLYKNKASLDVNQMGKQDAKSTIRFSLNSFINEDGEAGD